MQARIAVSVTQSEIESFVAFTDILAVKTFGSCGIPAPAKLCKTSNKRCCWLRQSHARHGGSANLRDLSAGVVPTGDHNRVAHMLACRLTDVAA